MHYPRSKVSCQFTQFSNCQGKRESNNLNLLLGLGLILMWVQRGVKKLHQRILPMLPTTTTMFQSMKRRSITCFMFLLSCALANQWPSPYTVTWTWLSGSSTAAQDPTYTAQNIPGAKRSGYLFQSTIDPNLVYMFEVRDLEFWTLNVSLSSNPTWKWIRSWTTTNFGSLGVASSTNTPPPRITTAMAQVDNDTFFMFGGLAANWNDGRNDLWSFRISTKIWTWIGGMTTVNTSPVYIGAKNPGAREGAAAFASMTLKKFFIYGGYGISFSNELWMYAISTSIWSLVSGQDSGAADDANYGVYSSPNTPCSSCFPHARSNPAYDSDGEDLFYVFGGSGGDSYNTQYSDLWRYRISDNTWTWLNGLSTTNVLSSPDQPFGLFSQNDVGPCSRERGILRIVSAEEIFLFGGRHFDALENEFAINDVWLYNFNLSSWSWVGGTVSADNPGSYPAILSSQCIGCFPAARTHVSGVVKKGFNEFFLFGGDDINRIKFSDFWKISAKVESCNNGTFYVPNIPLCPNCLAGFYSGAGLSTSCSVCPPGTYSSKEASSYCAACPAGSMASDFGSSSCSVCLEGFFAQTGNSVCHLCPTGSKTKSSGVQGSSSCYCLENTYGRAFANESCQPCASMDGLTCPQNSSLPFVLKGYARNPQYPQLAIHCQPEQACGLTGFSNLTICEIGYKGTLCQSCMTGFYRDGLKCSSCPSQWKLIIGPIIILISGLLILGTALRNKIIRKAEFKTLLLGLQTLALFPTLSASWPFELSNFLNFISLANFNLDFFAPGNTIDLTLIY
jgi:hypothetical protein